MVVLAICFPNGAFVGYSQHFLNSAAEFIVKQLMALKKPGGWLNDLLFVKRVETLLTLSYSTCLSCLCFRWWESDF